MNDDDALLASVLRKVMADPSTWTGGGSRRPDGTITLVIDGGTSVTPEEDAALERAYNQAHGGQR